MEHICASCDLRVYGRCTNGQSETCGEHVQQNDSCAGWFSTQEANTKAQCLKETADAIYHDQECG